MTGENFLRLNRGTDIKRIKEKILKLRNEWADIYYNQDGFDITKISKLDEISKEIQWQENLLWGLTGNH